MGPRHSTGFSIITDYTDMNDFTEFNKIKRIKLAAYKNKMACFVHIMR